MNILWQYPTPLYAKILGVNKHTSDIPKHTNITLQQAYSQH